MAGLDPAIHAVQHMRVSDVAKTWMPGSSPGITAISNRYSIEKQRCVHTLALFAGATAPKELAGRRIG